MSDLGRALRWLLDGNGQKLTPLPRRSPWAAEDAALRDALPSLMARKLVSVGPPTFGGQRWVTLTAAGRAEAYRVVEVRS